MAFASVLDKPLAPGTVEEEIMLHAQGITESEICKGRKCSEVLVFGLRPKCMYQVIDHSGALSLRRVYTVDDEQLFLCSLKIAESIWPTNLEMHSCDRCQRMAPGLATKILRTDGSISTLICHLVGVCGDIRPALKAMHEKEVFLRSVGIDVFPVWVDAEKYRVPKSIWCPPLTLKQQ